MVDNWLHPGNFWYACKSNDIYSSSNISQHQYSTRVKTVGTLLGRVKLSIYQGKCHNLLKKSNDPQITLLNKLSRQVLYQCFIQRLWDGTI